MVIISCLIYYYWIYLFLHCFSFISLCLKKKIKKLVFFNTCSYKILLYLYNLVGDLMNFNINKISKEELLKISEDDVMFITNPGRMGDEDGSTFIIRQGENFKIYRIDNLMYRNIEFNENEYISLNDLRKQFPKWSRAWKNSNKEFNEKYIYLYMGFGNGLSVDNSIFSLFKPYLDGRIQEYLKNKEQSDDLMYAAIFNTWEDAFIDMITEMKKSEI